MRAGAGNASLRYLAWPLGDVDVMPEGIGRVADVQHVQLVVEDSKGGALLF
jgi:hypothetical protein